MKSQSFATKLNVSFAAMLAVTLLGSYSSLTSLSTMKDIFDTAAQRTTKKIEMAGIINTSQATMLAAQRAMILCAFVEDASGQEAQKQKFRERADQVRKVIADLKPLLVDDRGKHAVKNVEEDFAAWVGHFEALTRLSEGKKPAEAWKYAVEKVLPIADAVGKAAQEVTDLQQEHLAADRKVFADQSSQSRWITFGLIGLALAVGGANLTFLRKTSRQLMQMAHELSQGAEQVASAASQVSSASQSLAQGASEQAASLEETSASSEEMASMTRRNAENAKTAAELMVEASHSVAEANSTLEQMVKSMNDINTSSGKISKIIKVIDEIAFQTNILALNAAVEAARAGEAGMGFAVVADEVRNLAQRSAQAAKDTAALIEESIARSGEGRTKLDEVANSIATITSNAEKVKTLVDEVNLGSQEQARGIEQVSKAVAQMEQVTQKTAASAEESASASQELSAQAGTTRTVVSRLQALVEGVAAGSQAEPALRGTSSSFLRSDGKRDLSALKAAVSRERHPSFQPARAAQEAIPLADDFKEF